jgi:hypothetical protein
VAVEPTTPTSDATSERPADPRPAWERIAYTWLTREVDAGQPTTAEQFATDTSVTLGFARDLLRVLHAHRQPARRLAGPLRRRRPPARRRHRPPHQPERVAAKVERAYWTREVRASEWLCALRLAREFGAEPHVIAAQLRELRAGPRTARERIEQLWHAHQQDPGIRPSSSSQLAHRLGVTDSYVRHVTWQLRTRAGIAPLADRLAASRE